MLYGSLFQSTACISRSKVELTKEKSSNTIGRRRAVASYYQAELYVVNLTV